MKNWSNADVMEFIHHRAYPGDVAGLMHEYKVDGLGLLEMVKDPKLLSGLHVLRALKLRNEIKAYNSSGITCMLLVVLFLK